MSQEHTDLDCIKRIRKGGHARAEGIAVLYRKYFSPMNRYFLGRGKTPEEAEDLIQEVFIQVIRKADSYRGDGAFSAWLWAIARNALTSDYRKASSRPPYANEEPPLFEGMSASSSSNTADDELQVCVRNAFTQFSQIHQERAQVLSLLSFHGWNIEEIAAFLGRTRAATREYLSQCRKHLRPFLQQCYGFLLP